MDAWIIEGEREGGTEGVREGREERKRKERQTIHTNIRAGW